MKNKKTGTILRIILYIAIIIALVLLKYTNILKFECYINNITGIKCPTCGFTRAITSLLNFDIINAIENNAFFTLVLFPTFLFLSIQDITYMIINLIKKKDCISYVEIIFG